MTLRDTDCYNGYHSATTTATLVKNLWELLQKDFLHAKCNFCQQKRCGDVTCVQAKPEIACPVDASTCCFSAVLVKPHHAGETHNSLERSTGL